MSERAFLLVVDDNDDIRDMLSRRLRKHGYDVDVAINGSRALEMIQGRKYDLVVLDIMMPGMNGFEVLKRIREDQSAVDLPVIMATARDRSEDVVGSLTMGANDYVTKPLDFPVVLARIQNQLSSKRLGEAKDEFMRIASHDLKTPLSVILGGGKLLESSLAPGTQMTEESSRLLRMVVRNAERMQRILEDFLDFQALRDGQVALELRATNLNQIAEEAVRQNQEYARAKGIGLRSELSADMPSIHADQARLAQVSHNLISNAIKFSPPGAEAVVSTAVAGEQVTFEVRDSGPGLTDDDLRHVFMKYAQLSNKPTGGEKSSGLGLAIAKLMVDLHGGRIGARNNPGGGATFWFTLPITCGPRPAPDSI